MLGPLEVEERGGGGGQVGAEGAVGSAGNFRLCWGQGLFVPGGREFLGQTFLKIRICFKYL